MGTVYVLGAGFSKTCGIATDAEMLDALNPLLPRLTGPRATFQTFIEDVKEQNFPQESAVGFELFMSTVASLKFMPEFMKLTPNIFSDGEREIRKALKRYLRDAVAKVDWDGSGKSILDFLRQVNWQTDSLITFNYDLLLEEALNKLNLSGNSCVLHLHGSLEDKTLIYPTYRKLAYKKARSRVAERWKDAFGVLRKLGRLDRLIFIGYSMPPSDLEAKGLFNYTDWYNAYMGNHAYSYPIVVVDRRPEVLENYAFIRKELKPQLMTFSDWVSVGMP